MDVKKIQINDAAYDIKDTVARELGVANTEEINDIISGNQIVGRSIISDNTAHALNADNANKALMDANGNIISNFTEVQLLGTEVMDNGLTQRIWQNGHVFTIRLGGTLTAPIPSNASINMPIPLPKGFRPATNWTRWVKISTDAYVQLRFMTTGYINIYHPFGNDGTAYEIPSGKQINIYETVMI